MLISCAETSLIQVGRTKSSNHASCDGRRMEREAESGLAEDCYCSNWGSTILDCDSNQPWERLVAKRIEVEPQAGRTPR